MDHVNIMNDKNYYAKPLASELKTLITVDFSSNKDPVIEQAVVDKFGRTLEKSVPLGLDDDNESPSVHDSPIQDDDHELEDLKHELAQKDALVKELEQNLAKKDEDLAKLKKKQEDSKVRLEKKEERINKLLRENESFQKENTILEEKIRDFETKLLQTAQDLENAEKIVKSLSADSKNADKQSEVTSLLQQELDSK